LLLAGLAWGTSSLFSPAFAQQFSTYTVDKIKAPGNYTLSFQSVPKKGKPPPPINATITVVNGDTPATVAMKVAKAFGAGFAVSKTNPAKVEYDLTASGNDEATIGASPNAVVGFTLDEEEKIGSLPPPNTQLADLGFLPNPSNGSDILATNSTITAGFASGLSPVSFTATAGEDLDQLASALDWALMSGGYLTSMPDSTDVVVYAKGVDLPIEVDFTIDPLSMVGESSVAIVSLRGIGNVSALESRSRANDVPDLHGRQDKGARQLRHRLPACPKNGQAAGADESDDHRRQRRYAGHSRHENRQSFWGGLRGQQD
jgi:hypothetical protein